MKLFSGSHVVRSGLVRLFNSAMKLLNASLNDDGALLCLPPPS